MIELYIVSFVAGILTVLAPCILPLLPVIIGGSSLQDKNQGKLSLRRPVTIIVSLVLSVVIFSLLLKATTTLLGIPTIVWAVISGGIVLLFGINLLFPILWDKFMMKTGLATLTNRLMGQSQLRDVCSEIHLSMSKYFLWSRQHMLQQQEVRLRLQRHRG